ncbi:MAG: MFS transporter [Candidatus Sungbacteria bacterium]|uniref:MFS transporter n=1 Tax=Candidatus Sungiibacteriota bacterium TaxID=2750080 RepID=A0A931SC76_9BACT|nr:MFS transporter [Candidatus Sungbacteria bacterium]
MSLIYLMSLRINPIVRMLVISDFFILAGLGFIGPMLPIFIVNQIPGGDVRAAGFAAAIYMAMWVFQIPIGRYLDRTKGERDDYTFLVAGAFITSAALFLFSVAETPWHIYLIQALAGLGRAIDLPAWYSIFTRKVDKKREGYEWGVENVTAALSVGFVSAIAGLIAEAYGFRALFILAGAASFIGALVLFFLYRSVFPRGHQ